MVANLFSAKVCSTAGMVLFGIQAAHGLGKHRDTISKADYLVYGQAGFWHSVIANSYASTFVKASIALTLLRLHLGIGRWYKWSLWAVLCKCLRLFLRTMSATPWTDLCALVSRHCVLGGHGPNELLLPLHPHGGTLG